MFRHLVRPSSPLIVEDLMIHGQRLTSDSNQSQALASIFFMKLPLDPDGSPMEDLDEPCAVPEPFSQHVPVTQSEII